MSRLKLFAKSPYIEIAGAVVVAIPVVLAGLMVVEATLSPSESATPSIPEALANLRGQGLAIEATPSPVEGLHTWQITSPEHPEATPQLAITAPGSEGFVIGELFDADGQPVSSRIMGQTARNGIAFHDLSVITQWLPALESDSDQQAYLFIDPLAAQSHALWQAAVEHQDELPSLRVVPTAYAHPGSFDAVLDIFGASDDADRSGIAQTARLTEYLSGNRDVPDHVRDNPTPSPLAVRALSTNSNIRHRLQLPEAPTLVTSRNDGLEVTAFDQYLSDQLDLSLITTTSARQHEETTQ